MMQAYAAFGSSVADWRLMLSLTYADVATSIERCKFDWGKLVQVLNRSLFGNHYVRRVGHSYFSYLVCAERQRRGALHLHAVVDDRIDLPLLHRYWGAFAGHVWAERIRDEKGIEYVVKYITKADDLGVSEWCGMYKAPQITAFPKFIPMWYSGGKRSGFKL